MWRHAHKNPTALLVDRMGFKRKKKITQFSALVWAVNYLKYNFSNFN